ncbi:sugar phosphate isomerase/epimerase [Niabella insulamsoli]|uniref:sugar phosphate isomerase/epimerase family protein n=1 Tax=Niabella insulamsoli TaxID=3144874 RepID=UPI0031FC39D1
MKQNRRKFIRQSAAGTAGLFLAKLEAAAAPSKGKKKLYDASVKILQTNWGFNGSLDEFCAQTKKAGYDGVELWWPADKKAQQDIFSALDKHNLEIGFVCGVYQKDPQEHLTAYKKMIDEAAKQNRKRPLYINNHSGKDYFSFEDNAKLIEHTNQLAKATGITICHETHRSRMLFAAPVAKEYIKKFPDLKLTLDISHWCCVHEGLLGDQQETVNLALERTEHIHARIGHAQGPQVNDPRAPEWDKAVQAHFEWWDKVVERKSAKGETITFLTEFGPPDYMPTMPHSRKPLADLWEVNTFMMQILKKRYAS